VLFFQVFTEQLEHFYNPTQNVIDEVENVVSKSTNASSCRYERTTLGILDSLSGPCPLSFAEFSVIVDVNRHRHRAILLSRDMMIVQRVFSLLSSLTPHANSSVCDQSLYARLAARAARMFPSATRLYGLASIDRKRIGL
jgi:hypothetical protein